MPTRAHLGGIWRRTGLQAQFIENRGSLDADVRSRPPAPLNPSVPTQALLRDTPSARITRHSRGYFWTFTLHVGNGSWCGGGLSRGGTMSHTAWYPTWHGIPCRWACRWRPICSSSQAATCLSATSIRKCARWLSLDSGDVSENSRENSICVGLGLALSVPMGFTVASVGAVDRHRRQYEYCGG